MAVPVRRHDHQVPSHTADVRLVVDRSAHHKAKKHAYRQELLSRRVFMLCTAFVALIVIVGLGPVWLSAEATRHSQQSLLIKKDITSEISRAQSLELRRSELTSASRINKIATQELQMVPIGDKVSYLEVGDSGTAPVLKETSALSKKNPALLAVARLTAGEASALLVGDVGLASSR